MPTTKIAGLVTDIFAHRFVVATSEGKILADLGPKGAERLTLQVGDQVELTGDMKPSELKVDSISRSGAARIDVPHGPAPQHDEPADPSLALETAAALNLTMIGAPRRKPKHFELLVRDSKGALMELHVELGGAMRHARPVDPADSKWSNQIPA